MLRTGLEKENILRSANQGKAGRLYNKSIKGRIHYGSGPVINHTEEIDEYKS